MAWVEVAGERVKEVASEGGRGVVAAVGSRALAGWELEAWGAAKVQGMLATVAG